MRTRIIFSLTFVLIGFKQLVFSEDRYDLEYCFFNVMGLERRLPRAFCDNVRTFGSKIKVRHNSDRSILVLGGSPGAGKSTLAREFAKKTNSHYIVINASGLMKSGFIGGGTAAISQAFDDALMHIARYKKGVVLIFEEIDSIAIPDRNSLNDEVSRACAEFNNRSSQNKNNPRLMIICTTNNYEGCNEAFKSRCTYIQIDQPTLDEKVKILGCLFVNDTIDYIQQKYAVVCAEYKEPLASLKDMIFVLIEQINSSCKTGFKELDIERTKLDILHCRKALEDIASDPAEDYLRFIKRLEEFVVSCEKEEPERIKLLLFTQLRTEVENLGNKYKSEVDQVMNRLFGLVSQVLKFDCDDRSSQAVAILKSSIEDSRSFFCSLQSCDLKDACYELLDDLGVFIKVYDLAFDAERMNFLAKKFDTDSTRSIEKLVYQIRSAALTRELNNEVLQAVKLSEETHGKSIVPTMQRYAFYLLDRTVLPVTNGLIGSAISSAIMRATTRNKNENTAESCGDKADDQSRCVSCCNSKGNCLDKASDIEKKAGRCCSNQDIQSQKSLSCNEGTRDEFSAVQLKTNVFYELLNDEDFLDYWRDRYGYDLGDSNQTESIASGDQSKLASQPMETVQQKLSGRMDAMRNLIFDTMLPCAHIVEGSCELFYELNDLYSMIRGTKDHLGPVDRYFFNVYSQKQEFLKRVRSIGLEEIKEQYFNALNKRLGNEIEVLLCRMQALNLEKQESTARCDALEEKSLALQQQINELKSKLESENCKVLEKEQASDDSGSGAN